MNLSAIIRIPFRPQALIFAGLMFLTTGLITSCYEENLSSTSGVSSLNLCEDQPANTFHCLDDTKFQLCTGNDNFVVNSCPVGLCATRSPANKNPCLGSERAAEIDGVVSCSFFAVRTCLTFSAFSFLAWLVYCLSCFY